MTVNLDEKTLRIGVSIPIPEPYAAQLAAARVDAGDPLARLVPPHITLVPPTDVSPSEYAQVEKHLRETASAHAPFIVELSGTGTFRPISPVVFVKVQLGESGCAGLQDALNAEVLAQQLQFPYHPHVTIAHNIAADALDQAAAGLAGFSATFPVVHFCLYEHGEDGVWREVADYALTS